MNDPQQDLLKSHPVESQDKSQVESQDDHETLSSNPDARQAPLKRPLDDNREEIPGEDLKSRDTNARLAEGNPLMTTLTLNAGLKEADFDKIVPAQAKEERPVPLELIAAENSGPGSEAGNIKGPVEKRIEGSIELPIAEVEAEIEIEEMDDHSLLAATRTGDEAAFQEIVRRYRNQITNYVYRLLDDYDRAVDMAQETFVRVYMNVDRYQATYNFSTYIYRIAHNLAISELRQRKRRRLIPLPTFFSDKDSEEVEVDLPDHRQVAADDAMIGDERRQAVSKAIASLPDKYRAPLVLCDIEEKSYEEISEVLGLPVGTVKSRINRARNLLKEKLRDLI